MLQTGKIMKLRVVAAHAAFALSLTLLLGGIAPPAKADTAAANACAANLSTDARTIFDKTLPQFAPGGDLRELLTTNTRSLAIAGTISRSSARESATAAAACLERVGS
jgi:hypothetical protein